MKSSISFKNEGLCLASSTGSTILAMRDTLYREDKQKGYLSLPIGKEKEYKNNHQKTERNPKKDSAQRRRNKKESKDEKKSVMNKTTTNRPKEKEGNESRKGRPTEDNPRKRA